MNTVSLIGRIARDPELRYGQSGTAVCMFTLAVDNPFKKDDTNFIPVKCFKKTAEVVAQYTGKGVKIGITGNLQSGNYEKDGQKRYTLDVIASQVTFCEPKRTVEQAAQDRFGGELTGEAGEDLPF